MLSRAWFEAWPAPLDARWLPETVAQLPEEALRRELLQVTRAPWLLSRSTLHGRPLRWRCEDFAVLRLRRGELRLTGVAASHRLRPGAALLCARGASFELHAGVAGASIERWALRRLRWSDVALRALSAAAEQDPRLRRYLPLDATCTEWPPLSPAQWRIGLERLAEELFAASAPAPPPASSRPPRGVWQRRPGLTRHLVRRGELIALRGGERTLLLPSALQAVAEFLCARDRFEPRELPGAWSASARAELLRRVWHTGLFEAAGRGADAAIEGCAMHERRARA